MPSATRSHSSSSGGSADSHSQQSSQPAARSASSPFVYYPPPPPPKDGRRAAQPGERGWVVWDDDAAADIEELADSEDDQEEEEQKTTGREAGRRRAEPLSLSSRTSANQSSRTRLAASSDRDKGRAQQPQSVRTSGRRVQQTAEEDDDEVMVVEEHTGRKTNAQQRKRKTMETSEDADEAKEAQPRRRRREQREEESKDQEEEEEGSATLHRAGKQAHQAVMVEDDSESEEQPLSEWTVGSRRAHGANESSGSRRAAAPASSTASSAPTKCADCKLQAKSLCTTGRCNKHCARMGMRCDVHKHKGSAKVAGSTERQRDDSAARARESVEVIDGGSQEDVPLSVKERGRGRVEEEAEEEGNGREEKEEEPPRAEQLSDEDSAEEQREERNSGGRDAADERRKEQAHPVGNEQSKSRRTHSKGSMDLSAVLQEQMDKRKAEAERRQLQQKQQQQQQPVDEEKQPSSHASAQRDYVSQALIESQLDDSLVALSAHVPSPYASTAPVAQSESEQPSADERKSAGASSDVVLDTPQSTLHATPISDRTLPTSASSVQPAASPPDASLGSLYLPAAAEEGTVRVHGPPLVVLHALRLHCGSAVNAQRWLDGLPALCKAGHEVEEWRPDGGYACSLCGCAAPWQPAEDAVVLRVGDGELRRAGKEEVSAELQQLVKHRGTEAIALRRVFLSSLSFEL